MIRGMSKGHSFFCYVKIIEFNYESLDKEIFVLYDELY